MPIMKYTPQFVERQYVPTNNLGLIDQVLGQRQKEYDTAKMMEDATVSELYGLQTTQGFQPERDRIVQELQNQIEAAAQKRGGDYGAAAKDISSIIASVQKNPFFQANRQVLEKSKILDQMQIRNPNIYIGNDIRKLGWREGLTAEDLDFNVLDPEDVRKLAKERLAHLGTRKLAGISTTESGYDVARYTTGPSEEDIQKLMQDEEFINSMKGNFPQLANSKDPALQDLFRREIEAAARSYKKDAEETVLGFNPYRRASMERQEQNPYQAVIPTMAVGSRGIENVYPIQKPKDFYNLPNDNSRMGLLRTSITQDILSDETFKEDNETYINEFKGLDNAKFIVDNYGSSESVNTYLENSPYYLKGSGPNERGKDKINREQYQRAKTFVNNFETKLNERLYKENSDLVAQFQHYDIFAGDKDTKTRMKDYQDYISTNFSLKDFVFEVSNNPDINFSDQQKLIKDKDKNYLNATEGNFNNTGLAVDPKLGIKLQIQTKNKDGGVTTHIAHPADRNIERAIIKAYTNGNPNSKIFQDYMKYDLGRTGEEILGQLKDYPELAPPSNAKTVGEYKNHLARLWRDNPNLEYAGKSIVTYFNSMGINDNTQL